MGRLAADVSYIHGLRRTVLQAVAENKFWSQSEQIEELLLPENRRTPAALTTHRQNIERLYNAMVACVIVSSRPFLTSKLQLNLC